MSNTLSSLSGFPVYTTSSVGIANSSEVAGVAFSKGKFEAVLTQVEESGGTRNYLALGLLVILLHGLAVVAYINRDQSSALAPVKHEVAIEFIKPEIIPPPPVVEPPPPPPPKVQKVTPPKPVAALRTAPAEENVKPTDIAIAENKEATHISGPAVAAPGPTDEEAPPAPPAPPAPKVEEPVTEATANAAYLNNPKPDYPPTAARQGWGGTVSLRVRVLADGHAESVTVKKSSGRKVLDDAAIAAVKNWTFVPSKRGSTPIDGWATVPVVFNPEQ